MKKFLSSYFLGLFFKPDSRLREIPSERDINFENVNFTSAGTRNLHGYFMKPQGDDRPSRGTIVHCHGNHGNVSGHSDFMDFLVREGFNVLTFDYGGYGQSKLIRPTPETIIDDAVAAIQFVKSRADVDPKKIALFGQSLGGAAASGAMVKDIEVKCLVLESAFTTYREMAFTTWTGRLLFPLTPMLIPDIGPLKDLPNINARPVLIIHGEDDQLIPPRFSKKLYEVAQGKKGLSILKGVYHLEGTEERPDYENRIIAFLETHL